MTIPPQVVFGALTLMAQVSQTRSRDQYETALAEYQAGVLHDLIDAAFHKRVGAVRSGFEIILKQYGDQIDHYLHQQQRYAEEQLACVDPIRRIDLQSRIQEVDKQLQYLRIDTQIVYAQMCNAIIELGGQTQGFADALMLKLSTNPSLTRQS